LARGHWLLASEEGTHVLSAASGLGFTLAIAKRTYINEPGVTIRFFGTSKLMTVLADGAN
jgi:hypothetical protein